MTTLKNQKGIDIMANTKMTKVQALSAIAEIVKDNAELSAFVAHEIDLLNKKSAKSAEKSAEKAQAYGAVRTAVREILADAENGMTVTEILKAYGDDDMTNQKMTYALKADIADGTLTKTTVKGKTYYKLAV
jgi:hypothetical protein